MEPALRQRYPSPLSIDRHHLSALPVELLCPSIDEQDAAMDIDSSTFSFNLASMDASRELAG